MTHLLLFSTLLTLLQSCFCITQVAPTWQTSNYVQAASYYVINGNSTNTKTGAANPPPIATLTFATAFPSVPNLAYGIPYYESSDNLGQQMYEVNRTDLTATSFSVKVFISGNTDIWITQVRYIAVSKSFPHHLNSFDNVPVNYNNGNLTAFTTRTNTLITYNNTINYTLQANSIGSAYNMFTAPYSNIKILLFMTSMFFDGKEPSSGFAPVDIVVDAFAISADQYKITVKLGVNALCDRLHYSMIIFDQADVERSGQYFLVCQRVNFTTSGGDVDLPLQFVTNAIMGFTDFSSDRTQSLINFFLNFQTLSNGSYGIHMRGSVARDPAKRPITRYGFTLFYLKTWLCPNLTYYNSTLNLCTECMITNCLKCFNDTQCQTCVSGYVLNAGHTGCDPIPCTLSNCISCLNTTYCQFCNSSASYDEVSGSCFLCNNNANDFINSTTLDCQHCSLLECTNCSSLTSCRECNQANGYFLNSSDQLCYACSLFGCSVCTNLTACLTCNASLFINTSDLCEACSLTDCQVCENLTSCLTCNTGLFKNTSNLCEACSIPDCQVCTNLTACLTCNAGLVKNSSDLCEVCTLSDCQVCINQTACQTCNPGLFINTSDLCEACSLSGCQVCQNLTSCQTCNASLFKNSSNLCEACSLPDCQVCANLTACSTCNPGLFLNSTDLCEACSLSDCQVCQNLTSCLTCNAGLFKNTSNLCQACSLNDCQVCENLTSCLTCNAGIFKNDSNLCEACSLSDCQVCENLTSCLTCNTGVFKNESNLCEACSISDCQVCENLTSCLTCNVGTFKNSSNLCEACSVDNCVVCENLTACTACDLGYWLNSSQLCQHCLQGCLNCTEVGDCIECDLSQSYVIRNGTCQRCQVHLNLFLNITTETCEPCTLNQCSTCSSLTECLICNTNNSYYLIPNSTCELCNNLEQKFINQLLECQQCNLTQCLNCSSLTTCIQCNTSNNYFLNNTDNKCQPCTLSNCLQCSSLTQCLVCDEASQFFLNQTTLLCQPCSLVGCLNCTSLEVCYQCDSANGYNSDYTTPNHSQCSTSCNVTCMCDGYDLPWIPGSAQCTPICGDGLILLTELCDDNNNSTGDGCSDLCQVQPTYTCVGQPSNCTQNLLPPKLQIEAEGYNIQKQGCNGFVIKILKQIVANQEIGIKNPGIFIKSIVQNGSHIDIHTQYSRDIVNEQIILTLNDSEAHLTYEPVTPTLFYTEDQCKSQQNVERLVLGVQIMSYTVLFASVFSCKIVGLELFGVLQLAYFTLADHSFFNSYLAPLTSFKTLNGINLRMVPQSRQVSKPEKQMGVASTFLNNCNIMFLMSLSQLFIAGILYLVSKLINARKLYTTSLHLLKQGFITMILFNALNFSFSAGIHIKYANKQDQYYTVSTVFMIIALLAMIVATIVMQFTSSDTYGQFKNKYKQTFICRLFVPITLVYRMILGFYMAVKSQQQQSTLIILSVVITFMLYLLTNLPYNDTYQNYRTVIMHTTIVVILFTTNYYRSMKSNTPLQIKARIHTPALIQLGLIVTCVLVSTLAVIYELYLFIRQCWKYRKSKQSITNNKTQQSEMDIDIQTRSRKQSTEQWITN